MTFRTPASRKSLITRSAFFSPRLCGTFLRSVLYPAWVNIVCMAVRMCSCAPIVAPACCVRFFGESVAESVNSLAFARAFVMCELVQVRDGQSQLLAVEGCPVLKHFLFVEVV
jgi:hypothetical protein